MTPVNRRLVGIALFGLLLVANEYAPEPIEIPGMGWVESLFGVGSGPVRVLIVEDSTKRDEFTVDVDLFNALHGDSWRLECGEV